MSPGRAPADASALRSGPAGGVPASALLAFVPLIVAAALTLSASSSDGVPFDDVVLLPPDPLSPGRFAVGLLAMIAGYAGVFFAPGLLWMRTLRIRPGNVVTAALAAFTISLAGTSLAWIAAQATTEGLAGRTCVYLTVAVLDTLALLIGVFRAPGSPALPALGGAAARRQLLVPVAGVALVLAAAWLTMPGKVTTEALEGDATEVHGFAASLFREALPEWDLERDVTWGFYPTFVWVAYPVFFSLALGGESEAAVRMPALLFLGVLMLALADLAGRDRTRWAGGALPVLLPVLVAGYLSIQVGAYYAGYHPVHGDLGCSPLEEWVVTAMAMCAVVLLRDGAPGLAAVAALLSVLTFPSGLMFAGLAGVAGFATGTPAERRTALRAAGVLAGLAAAWAVTLTIVTKANGTFDAMMAEWIQKYFARRAGFLSESPSRMLAALGWYTLLAGGLPVAGLVVAWRGDRVTRWLGLLAGVWVAFFVLSPGKNIHYFLPAALIPAAVSARLFPSRAVAAALVASGLVCIALCRPSPLPSPYTADRDFGRRTLFLAGSERQAVEYSQVIFNLVEPLARWAPGAPWSIGHHTWVMYADRGFEPRRDYDFYVGEGPPPVEGLTEITRTPLAGGRTAKMWARGGRAAFREWKERRFPAKRDLSRFDFEMPPVAKAR